MSSGQGPDQEDLARVLRAGVARLAERLGGAPALLFLGGPEGPPRLAAAAGFATADEARRAARQVERFARLVVASSHSLHRPAGDAPGPLSGRELFGHPLAYAGRSHGALVAGPAGAPPADAGAVLGRLAEQLGLRLDHDHLAREVERLRRKHATGEVPEARLLELSEALFAQDIELRRSREELGRVEQLKNDFIEKMSRELRTPLNAIIEAIISVLAGENERISDQARSALRQALDEGTAFLRTLQNILDLWKIKQGEMRPARQEVNFPDVVEEAIFSIQDTLGDKPVEIERAIASPFPKIRTDLRMISQIVFLLLDNAAKFTPRGTIRVAAEVQAGVLRCAVEDTGIGIAPDDRQFLFDEFYQVDELSSTRYRGAGLGLALARDLLGILKGSIEVESEIGRGSTFRFQVPVEVVG